MQVLQLSGIVALFFSGVFHAHYSYYSVAPDAQITLRRFFQFAAFLSETFVFAYLGLQVSPPFILHPVLWSSSGTFPAGKRHALILAMQPLVTFLWRHQRCLQTSAQYAHIPVIIQHLSGQRSVYRFEEGALLTRDGPVARLHV